MFGPFIEEKSCPSCPHLCQLSQDSATFSEHLVDVVHKLQAKNDVVPNVEIYSHAVNATLFDLKPSHFFWVVVFEFKSYISSRSPLADEVNLDNLHFCRFVLFEILFLNVSQKCLFVGLQRLIIFILCQSTHTRHNISDTLTLKFSTLTFVLAGS
jgi:hypothetical protein